MRWYEYFDTVIDRSNVSKLVFDTNEPMVSTFKEWVKFNDTLLYLSNENKEWINNEVINTLEIADRNTNIDKETILSDLRNRFSNKIHRHLIYECFILSLAKDQPDIISKMSLAAKTVNIEPASTIVNRILADNIEPMVSDLNFIFSVYHIEMLLSDLQPNNILHIIGEKICLTNEERALSYEIINEFYQPEISILKPLECKKYAHAYHDFRLRYFTDYPDVGTYHIFPPILAEKYDSLIETANSVVDSFGPDIHRNAIMLHDFFIDSGFTTDFFTSIFDSAEFKTPLIEFAEHVYDGFRSWSNMFISDSIEKLSDDQLTMKLQEKETRLVILDSLSKMSDNSGNI